MLERLVRDGLVKKREVEQETRPDKVVYRITRAGHKELDEWLESPFVRQGGYRDDFFLKLAAASRLGRNQLKSVLRTQREAYLAELSALAQLRSRHDDEPLISLLVEAAILHMEANLRVVELAEKNAKQLAATPQTKRTAATAKHARSA